MLEWLLSKRQVITTVGQVVQKNVNWYNHYGFPQKIRNAVTIWPNNTCSGYPPEKCENISLQRYTHSDVHCSIMHDDQDMETKNVSFDRWLDNDDVVHVYNEILFSHKKR